MREPHVHGCTLRAVRLSDRERVVASVAPVPVYEGNTLKRFDLSIELCPTPREIGVVPWPAYLPQRQIDQLQAENPEWNLKPWFKPLPEPPSKPSAHLAEPSFPELVARFLQARLEPQPEPVERRVERAIAETDRSLRRYL